MSGPALELGAARGGGVRGGRRWRRRALGWTWHAARAQRRALGLPSLAGCREAAHAHAHAAWTGAADGGGRLLRRGLGGSGRVVGQGTPAGLRCRGRRCGLYGCVGSGVMGRGSFG